METKQRKFLSGIKFKMEISFSKFFSLLVFLGCMYLDLKITKSFAATSMAIPFCSALIFGKQYNDRIKLKDQKDDSNIQDSSKK